MKKNIVKDYFLNFSKENKLPIASLITLSLLMNLLQVIVIAYVVSKIIQAVNKKNMNELVTNYQFFIMVSLTFVFLLFLYKRVQAYTSTHFRHWMRFEMVKYILNHNNINLSNINFIIFNVPINRISTMYFYIFNNIISFVFPNVSMFLLVIGFFMYKSFELGLAFLLFNILIIAAFIYSFPTLMDYNRNYEQNVTKSESNIIELLNNVDKIVTLGQSKKELSTLENNITDTIDTSIKFYKKADTNSTLLNTLAYVNIFVCLAIMIYKYKNNAITKLVFVNIITVLLIYREKITSVINQMPDYVEFFGRSEYGVHLFNKINTDHISTDFEDFELPFNHIRFKNVTFKYTGTNKNVLTNFSTEIKFKKAHTIFGIKGNSGIGKSTIAKLLIKLYDNYEGDIEIDGINIRKLDNDYIRKHITYVNQNTRLFDKKIIENIFYGCGNVTHCKSMYREIIKNSKIQSLFKNKNFFENNAGLFGENLSGGQRQVVNLMNGLINSSEIVVLDEPTNALDMELKKEVISLIKKFKEHKKAIIIITHDKMLNDIFDDVIIV